MGPKKPGAGKKSDIDDQEEALQAVLLADSFRKRMAPITYTTPKCLLPVANVPVIEYTFELLVAAGVKELFIVCTAHSEKIQEYIESSTSCKQFEVSVIVAPNCKSMGAALREVDSRGKIRGDFILVNGDVISNIKVEPALLAHKQRREEEKNKDAIITMVFKTSQPSQRRTFFKEEDICLAVNEETKQLMHYQPMDTKGFQLNVDRFETNPSLQMRYDLEYGHVSVCSPEVLCLFTDEFDWQDLHNDFVPGVLYSEILSYQIHTYIVSEGYSGRLTSLHSYGALSRDIIHRWSYPLVPDVNLFCESTYEYFHPGVYKEENVSLAQSCVIGEDSLIGSATKVGEQAKIRDSVIGRGCTIGQGAEIKGCIIFGNVAIGPNCKLIDSIVGSDVEIMSDVEVATNCVIASGVILGEGVRLKEGSRVAAAKRNEEAGADDDDFGDDDFSDEDKAEEEMKTDTSVVGAKGRGWMWKPDEDEVESLKAQLVSARIDDDDDEVEGDLEEDEDEDDEDGGAKGALTFEQEVEDIVRRGVEEDVKADNIAMEVNSRKFAHDKSFGDCSCVILVTILRTMPFVSSRKEAFGNVQKLIKKWDALLKKFARSADDQQATIEAMEAFVVDEKWKVHKLMMPILKTLYDEDIFEDEAILNWAQDAKEREDDGTAKALVAECKTLLEYLEDDDDDEDDDDEDDDE